MFTAAHGSSQPRRSHQWIAGVVGRNSISDQRNLLLPVRILSLYLCFDPVHKSANEPAHVDARYPAPDLITDFDVPSALHTE
ncbi:hypothetical protein EVAR_66514_1 [Eumeta japonica]|uniref:Uncharacterized protein n=1 Tax=Eumeta variegata TaxID=151549 RepID=A0A4C1ZA07_EUMVA|nr:hypothetical protein EVAR_66514_1 [Eumeta japonica]